MTLFAFLNQILPVLQFILILAGLIGGTVAGVFMVKNIKKTGLVQIQDQTIMTMQRSIDALKEQNAQQQEKIDRLEFDSRAMREALKDEYGIFITVDGEKVTIKDMREPGTTRHITKKPVKKVTPTAPPGA